MTYYNKGLTRERLQIHVFDFQGLKKQEAWMENIRTIMSERGNSLDADVRR